jgi:hypothetical protein
MEEVAEAVSGLHVLVANWAARALVGWLQQVPPEQLRDWIRADADLSEELPIGFGLPNIGLTRVAMVKLLEGIGEADYEAIRLRLAAHLPLHAAMLGLEEAYPWYIRTMEGLRLRLLNELKAKGGASR